MSPESEISAFNHITAEIWKLLTFVVRQSVNDSTLLPVPNKYASLHTAKQYRLTLCREHGPKSAIRVGLCLFARVGKYIRFLLISLSYTKQSSKASEVAHEYMRTGGV